jgi:hypothetical protein
MRLCCKVDSSRPLRHCTGGTALSHTSRLRETGAGRHRLPAWLPDSRAAHACLVFVRAAAALAAGAGVCCPKTNITVEEEEDLLVYTAPPSTPPIPGTPRAPAPPPAPPGSLSPPAEGDVVVTASLGPGVCLRCCSHHSQQPLLSPSLPPSAATIAATGHCHCSHHCCHRCRNHCCHCCRHRCCRPLSPLSPPPAPPAPPGSLPPPGEGNTVVTSSLEMGAFLQGAAAVQGPVRPAQSVAPNTIAAEVTVTASCPRMPLPGEPGYTTICKHDNTSNLQIGGGVAVAPTCLLQAASAAAQRLQASAAVLLFFKTAYDWTSWTHGSAQVAC